MEGQRVQYRSKRIISILLLFFSIFLFRFVLTSQFYLDLEKKSKRKVQRVPQSQTAALPRPQKEEETDKFKQAQTEQTYEKH